MKHWRNLLITLVPAAVVAVTAAGLALAGGAKTTGAKIAVAASPLGRILVDGKGDTLYEFAKDTGDASTCYGACATTWLPLTTSGSPVSGPGVHASLLGTTKRQNGKLEVTYNGHPLYNFVTDRKPGQTTGQGLDQFGGHWWVVSAQGDEIQRRGTPSPSVPVPQVDTGSGSSAATTSATATSSTPASGEPDATAGTVGESQVPDCMPGQTIANQAAVNTGDSDDDDHGDVSDGDGCI